MRSWLLFSDRLNAEIGFFNNINDVFNREAVGREKSGEVIDVGRRSSGECFWVLSERKSWRGCHRRYGK